MASPYLQMTIVEYVWSGMEWTTSTPVLWRRRKPTADIYLHRYVDPLGSKSFFGTTIYLEIKTYISIKILFYQFGNFLEPLLLTRINFKPSMDD